MTDRRDRDVQVEALLRRALQTPPVADPSVGATAACLDAETMAAWADGGLSGEAFEMAISHVADCARCQALVGAMARTEAAARATADPARSSWRWMRWLVPVAAAASVGVVVWVNRPYEMGPAMPQAIDAPAKLADAKAAKEESARRDEAPAQPSGTRDQRQNAQNEKKDAKRESDADRLGQTKNVAPPAAPAAAAAPPAAAAEKAAGRLERNAALADAFAFLEIRSPDAAIRWRVKGALVERSTDGGTTWTAVPTGIDADLTAGSSPAPSICWLVGRRGMVLLSADARTWRRIAFPEVTDLTAITATDARTAVVTTADGRTFATTDGGVTWRQGV